MHDCMIYIIRITGSLFKTFQHNLEWDITDAASLNKLICKMGEKLMKINIINVLFLSYSVMKQH